MSRSFLLIAILLLSNFVGFSQDIAFKLISTVDLEAEFFTTDNLGNLYVISGSELIKYSKSGERLYDFSKRNQGSFKFVDARDPLKILVYYPDFGLVDFLDNRLSENSFLNLTEYEIFQPTAVCRSINNGIWIYDPQRMQILLVNSELGIVSESNLFQQLFSDQYEPGFMAESENWLVIADSQKGFRIFDRLAAFYKKIDIKGLKSFQVAEDDLFFMHDGKLRSINIRTDVRSTVETPDLSKAIDCRIERDRIYILFKDRIDIYKLQ